MLLKWAEGIIKSGSLATGIELYGHLIWGLLDIFPLVIDTWHIIYIGSNSSLIIRSKAKSIKGQNMIRLYSGPML